MLLLIFYLLLALILPTLAIFIVMQYRLWRKVNMKNIFILLSLLQAALFLFLYMAHDASLFQLLLFLSVVGVIIAGWDVVLLVSARMNREPMFGLATATFITGIPNGAFVLFILWITIQRM